MSKITLKNTFGIHKDELKNKLIGYVLPKDSKQIEQDVAAFLNSLFDDNGEFRMGLTQSEDYIMQAAMSLLEAQRSMASSLLVQAKPTPKRISPELSSPAVGLTKDLYPHTVGATAIGSAVGGLVLGTWGAVFGSIAGTALILYIANQSKTTSNVQSKAIEYDPNTPFDAEKYVQIVEGICERIDSLINTFRTQIQNVVNHYENQPKPTLEGNYGILLQGIQSLIGYKRAHTSEEEKYVSKLQERIEDISELLENYNLTVVDYSEENASLFEEAESSKVNEPTMVYPAIVKDNRAILKGKVFVKKQLN